MVFLRGRAILKNQINPHVAKVMVDIVLKSKYPGMEVEIKRRDKRNKELKAKAEGKGKIRRGFVYMRTIEIFFKINRKDYEVLCTASRKFGEWAQEMDVATAKEIEAILNKTTNRFYEIGHLLCHEGYSRQEILDLKNRAIKIVNDDRRAALDSKQRQHVRGFRTPTVQHATRYVDVVN